jgi:hypothetical protein
MIVCAVSRWARGSSLIRISILPPSGWQKILYSVKVPECQTAYQVSPKLLSFQLVLSFLRWLIRVRSFSFNKSARILRATDRPAVRLIEVIAAILSLSLSHMVSVFSFYAMGSHDRPSRKKEKTRLLAHLAFASPPLYTARGPLFPQLARRVFANH